MIHAARPVLADGNLDSGGDSLSVPVMVNPLCTVAEYPVLVTFGAEENDNGICQGQRNATLMSLASGESATFSVDRDVVTLRDNEEYCYIVSISGETGELTACAISTAPEHVHTTCMSADRLHEKESLACNLH